MIAVSDLMFQPRIAAAVETLGFEAVVADDAPSAGAAIAAKAPALVIVDLHAAGIDTGALIRSARAAGAGVLAFGRHTEPGTLRAARDAGATRVVARSQLVEDLAGWIREGIAAAGLPAPATEGGVESGAQNR